MMISRVMIMMMMIMMIMVIMVASTSSFITMIMDMIKFLIWPLLFIEICLLVYPTVMLLFIIKMHHLVAIMIISTSTMHSMLKSMVIEHMSLYVWMIKFLFVRK
jgi:hypothetical protein